MLRETTDCGPEFSASDARQLEVKLTPRGEEFARAVVAAIARLNRRTAERVEPAQLLAADAVLRASLPDDDARELAARLVPVPRAEDLVP